MRRRALVVRGPRRRRIVYWEVYKQCKRCGERRVIATFNSRKEASAYARLRRVAADGDFITIERGW